MIKPFLAAFIFLSSQAFASLSGNVGATYTFSPDQGKSIYLRPYANLIHQKEYESFETKASFRAFTDVASEYDQDRFDVRELYALKQTDNWTHKIGAQLISFSETFGVQILDIANPRDYTDFIINDLTWSKLPTWGVNSIYTKEGYSLQLIFVPLAAKDILPRKRSFFDFASEKGINYSDHVENREVFRDSEYGLRVGKLFDSGFDVNFLYYHHLNRTPVFHFEGARFETTYKAVNSIGGSFSYALDEVVFRGDTLYTFNDYSQDGDLRLLEGDRLQYIYGVDFSFVEDWTLGYQIQYRQLPSFYWSSVFIQHRLSENWTAEFFTFTGMNNLDLWIQPKLSYRQGGLLVSAQADLLDSDSGDPGIFGPYGKKDRFLTTVEYQF